ncbi:MAG TPA: isoaspartyl peptidase/L-asparaginase [Pyrinomonadaceae bacterium]|nr:isoaspartyl peptidase/L-asparaginase [Chloracidobacterium sp.]MBP9934453.1 isoaspartyl peptidase/L-asparaginase [Pyrinomonadaceae bacterium]MBK7802564.1 isoaspartyl peptidase/L-asparaginase [Chloracidobacterium sp.]MBK9437419.1 isoaspartyl peptidase/L-asparaginase [Chloracidobacterium sp.]MBL0240089.1 isoaspartyl peptidase/L-asparaginase [Chloracidobacterium sp.]
MKKVLLVLLIVAIVLPLTALGQKNSFGEIKQLQSPQDPRLGFIIHGGAGVISKAAMTPETEKQFRAKLEESLIAGYKALQAGRSSLDAVEIAIRILEDSPLFNAGKGAVFTNDGKNELDASIMYGKNLAAGSAAGLRHIKNPITLARAIMEKSEHVMMVGDGAEKFAKEQKVEFADEKYFWTQHRWDALQIVLKEEKTKIEKSKLKSQNCANHDCAQSPDLGTRSVSASGESQNRFGTVGAVALDRFGDLAAGTSTGGMTNKKYGRVGDAPIIGAGTYANNDSCAVSATGWGEYFIRLGVARDIAALMEYRAMPIQNAADLVIKQKLQKLGGDGGIIAMDKFGNMAISFNSEGMYRAYIGADGKPVVEIY